ncbi:MAG TPA: hypothetical protein VGQ33_22750 [Vicinamibacteria bacterium]|nr:hypothetical protein [Vicinamibacteria bacterium]
MIRTGAFLAAAAAVALAGWAAGLFVTGSIHLDGATGDWRAASEGLYRSGQPEVLGAARRAVVHFHGLDGRAAVVTIDASARPSNAPVRLTAVATTGPVTVAPIEVNAFLEPTAIRVAVPKGAHDVDVRVDASALFRVSGIALLRARDGMALLASGLAAAVGVGALGLAWPRAPRGVAVVWALLAAAAVAALWTFVRDPASALRVAPTLRMASRVVALSLLWIAALASARSRVTAALAIVGTVAVLYLPTVWYGFYQDDFALARGWSGRELASTLHGEFDPSGMIPAYFRPVVRLSWALDHALWGVRTAGYHGTNIALHAVAGLLLLELLRRALLPPAAALLGALAWVAHPLAASGVAWVSERGDGLATVFFLAALVVFAAPARSTFASLVVLGAFVALALGAKEMAATLAPVALLLDRVLLPHQGRAMRRGRLRVIAGVTAMYLGYWVSIFAFKLAGRTSSGPRWAGFETRDAGHWLRLLPGLYAPLFLPTSYERWWTTALARWSCFYLAAGIMIAVATWMVARGQPLARRAATAGLLWPLLTVLPLLGLSSTLDLYRLGYLVSVGVAFVVAALASRLVRWPAAVAALAVALAAALSPLSIDAARAWAPDGFRGRASLHWKVAEPAWVYQLTPEMQGVFAETVSGRCHALSWAYPDDRCP